MKRVCVFAVILAQLTCLLGLPGGCESRNAAAPSATPSVSSSAPSGPAAAVCMGAVDHPVHRVVQLGFVEAADELGYNGQILGLDRGSWQELSACWLQGAKEYDIAGAVCWVGDDSGYEFLKELHGMGVKIAVPYFPHAYSQTKEFIDVNVHQDYDAAAIETADFIVKALAEKGIRSGDVGISVPGTPQPAGLQTFRDYMRKTYPEYNILEEVYESAELPAATAKVEALLRTSPDLVAGFGLSGYSAQVWAAAKESTGRRDVVVVGYDYTTENLDVLSGGGVDALISQPLYEAGAEGLALLDQMFCGKVYSTSETVWKQPLDMPLIYPGGVGVHDPARCHDLYKRAQARFGDCT